MCLYTLSTAPHQSSQYPLCLSLVQPQDDLILLGDALYGLLNPQLTFPNPVFGLREDWQLRFNTTAPPAHLQLIEYADWVALSLKHPQSVAWS